MYDMYPDWGPARHRDEAERQPYRQMLQDAFDARDAAGDRPDDN